MWYNYHRNIKNKGTPSLIWRIEIKILSIPWCKSTKPSCSFIYILILYIHYLNSDGQKPGITPWVKSCRTWNHCPCHFLLSMVMPTKLATLSFHKKCSTRHEVVIKNWRLSWYQYQSDYFPFDVKVILPNIVELHI